MAIKPVIGLFGGTFDPIHFGHLNIAELVLKQLNITEIEFIPCCQPPHRPQPIANAKHRLAMLELATHNNPKLQVNDCEINRGGISYTSDTLQEFAKDDSKHYAFIIGTDAFNHFFTWHNWQTILENAHLIVVNRPGHKLTTNTRLQEFINQHLSLSFADLESTPNGHILALQLPPQHCSATEIRNRISHGKPVSKSLPESVFTYIEKNKLYNF